MKQLLHIPTGSIVQFFRDKGDKIQSLFPDGEVQTLPAGEFTEDLKAAAKKKPEKKPVPVEDELEVNDDGTFK